MKETQYRLFKYNDLLIMYMRVGSGPIVMLLFLVKIVSNNTTLCAGCHNDHKIISVYFCGPRHIT